MHLVNTIYCLQSSCFQILSFIMRGSFIIRSPVFEYEIAFWEFEGIFLVALNFLVTYMNIWIILHIRKLITVIGLVKTFLVKWRFQKGLFLDFFPGREKMNWAQKNCLSLLTYTTVKKMVSSQKKIWWHLVGMGIRRKLQRWSFSKA